MDNADWLREKKVNILVQYADARAPDLPDVPLMMELGRNDNEKRALKLFAMGNAMGRSIMATPEIPADRVAVLRKAFMDTMQDPELVSLTRDKNIDFGPALDGAALAKLVDETLNVSPEVVSLAKAARGE